MSESETPKPEETKSEPPVSPEATRIAELEKEVATLRDAIIRSTADQQNQQRRHRQEREDTRKFATANLIEELLPALDSLELGLNSSPAQGEGRAVAEGFRMAIQQLHSILSSQGLTEINPVGKPFDHAKHEAVAQEASDTIAEGVIIKVARKGWLLNERVLRHASVIVSSGNSAK
jgi:molecular chaperone GrpE